MMQKFSTTASDKEPAVMLRTVIVAEPVVSEDTMAVYAPGVTPLSAKVKITVSFAEMVAFVSVKVTLVVAPRAAPSIVITPADLFKVTPVDLLVICVTAPWAAAA